MLASQGGRGEDNAIVILLGTPHNDPGTAPEGAAPNWEECKGKDPEASRKREMTSRGLTRKGKSGETSISFGPAVLEGKFP